MSRVTRSRETLDLRARKAGCDPRGRMLTNPRAFSSGGTAGNFPYHVTYPTTSETEATVPENTSEVSESHAIPVQIRQIKVPAWVSWLPTSGSFPAKPTALPSPPLLSWENWGGRAGLASQVHTACGGLKGCGCCLHEEAAESGHGWGATVTGYRKCPQSHLQHTECRQRISLRERKSQ
jgi:hypothetical protein